MPVTTNPTTASGIKFALGLIGAKTCLSLSFRPVTIPGGRPDVPGTIFANLGVNPVRGRSPTYTRNLS